jgi:hypothetical protein
LKTLAQLKGPQTLKDFSAAAGLSPAKVYRYLVSLIREGWIEQNAIDSRYDFGGAAREIGRAAINRLDIMRIGTPILIDPRPDLTKHRIAKEIAEHKRSGLDFPVKSEEEAVRKLADVRTRGFSLVRGDLIRGDRRHGRARAGLQERPRSAVGGGWAFQEH